MTKKLLFIFSTFLLIGIIPISFGFDFTISSPVSCMNGAKLQVDSKINNEDVCVNAESAIESKPFCQKLTRDQLKASLESQVVGKGISNHDLVSLLDYFYFRLHRMQKQTTPGKDFCTIKLAEKKF